MFDIHLCQTMATLLLRSLSTLTVQVKEAQKVVKLGLCLKCDHFLGLSSKNHESEFKRNGIKHCQWCWLLLEWPALDSHLVFPLHMALLGQDFPGQCRRQDHLQYRHRHHEYQYHQYCLQHHFDTTIVIVTWSSIIHIPPTCSLAADYRLPYILYTIWHDHHTLLWTIFRLSSVYQIINLFHIEIKIATCSQAGKGSSLELTHWRQELTSALLLNTCESSVISHQLSIINYQLSIINH